MGETTNEVRSIDDWNRSKLEPSSAASVSESGAHPEEGSEDATQIRLGIEQTRANLTDTIDALQEKLDPARIAEQVKDQIREKATEAYDTAKTAVKEATIGRAGKIVSSVSETVSDMMASPTGTAVRDTSSSVVQYIRDNPIPFALLGIGLGMLAVNRRRTQPSPYGASSNVDPSVYNRSPTGNQSASDPSLTDRARDAVSGVADTARGAATSVADNARAVAARATSTVNSAAASVRDAAGTAAETTRQQFNYVSDQAKQGARVATDRFSSTLQDNPMALGIAALAAGALVGLSLPTTRVEGQYMGEARDRLVDQAKSVAHDAAEKVQRVAEEAGRTIKDAAQKEGFVGAESGGNKA